MMRDREGNCFIQNASSLFMLLVWVTVASVLATALARAQTSTNSGQPTATGGGVVTPQQKYCPPGEPTCVPVVTNKPPTISWTKAPAAGEYFLPSSTISLGATASDPDGSVTQVEFDVSGAGYKTDTSAPYTATFSGLSDGSHTVYAVAFDNDGRTTKSSIITIHVVSGSIAANPDPCNLAQGATTCTTSISWTSSSSSAQVWVESIGGSSEQLFASAQSGQQSASWISAHGDHFMMKIGGLTLASVNVHGNKPPMVAWGTVPVEGENFIAGDAISLSAIASDPDGSVANVELVVDGSVHSTLAQSPYTTKLSGLPVGTHSIYAIAFDNHGNSASTGAVTFNVRQSIVKGHVDGVSGSGIITGWACSTYLPQSIKVDVYVGGTAGGAGTMIGRYPANESSEPAVASACDVGSGSYRYHIQLTQSQRQSYHGEGLYVYGISPVGGSNNELTDSGSYTVPAIPPQVADTTTFTYDALGRVIAVHDGAGHLKASYTYDDDDNVTRVTDALKHTTTTTYDALGRVGTITDAGGDVTTYHYDRGGRVNEVIDPRGNATTYLYDGFGQLWELSSPDTGITTYSYAPDGQLQGMARADGTVITYTYDSLGRPTVIDTGSQTRHITYDNCTNGLGRVCSVSDAASTTAYTYDAQGDITSRRFTLGSTTYALGYHYDGMGRLATLTYPDGNQATYHYQYGLLASITATINGVTKPVAHAITYRSGDRRLKAWTAGNGRVNTYTYDSDGRLTRIAVPGVQSLGFTYDAANRITQITHGIHPSLTQAYTYDRVNRLIQVASPAGNQSFAYDANGNRTAHTVNGVTTPSVIEPTSNRLASVGGQAIGYDADGNMVSKGGVTLYHYDSFNRLHSAGGAIFTVNPEGQRLRKSGPNGTTYFAPDHSGKLLADDQQGTWKDYVWLGDRMVGMLDGGKVYALHSDQTGRVLAITNPSGAVVWAAKGLALDRDTVAGSSAFFRLGFPGQYWDVEDSLWHNGYRDYDPKLGRYIESDPMGLKGGWNTYAYVGNNPIDSIDPLGLAGWIRCHGNDVTIALQIKFIGGTEDDWARMANSIMKAWTGRFSAYGNTYNVHMYVFVNTTLTIPSNTIHVMSGYSDSSGKISRTKGNIGWWYSTPSRIDGIDYAHEAGHLLGLPDEDGTIGTIMDPYGTGAHPGWGQIYDLLHNPGYHNDEGCGCQ